MKVSEDSTDKLTGLGANVEPLLDDELSFEMKSDSELELSSDSDLKTEDMASDSESIPRYARYAEGTWLFWTEVEPEINSIEELELARSIKEVES